MANSSMIWIIIGLTLFWSSADAGFYIPKEEYIFYVGSSLKSNEAIGTVHLSMHNVIKCGDRVLVIDPATPPQISVAFKSPQIYISVSPGVDSLTVKDPITFEVKVNCEASQLLAAYYEPLSRSKIVLINDSFPVDVAVPAGAAEGNKKNRQSENLCPGTEDLVYRVIENTQPGVIDVFTDHRRRGLPAVNLSLASVAGEYLFLNSSTGELHLLKSPNREEVEKISQAVTCNVNTNVQNTGKITVYVYDVDDNPPYSAFKESVQILNHNVTRSQLVLDTYDYDSEHITTQKMYHITTNDTLGIVNINSTLFHHFRLPLFMNVTRIKTVVNIKAENLSEVYTVDVVLEDLYYISTDVTNPAMSNKAVHRIIVPANSHTTMSKEPSKATALEVSLDISAAKYSLVKQLGEGSNKTGQKATSYEIDGVIPPAMNNTLAVTADGVVYVADPDKLFSYDNHHPITVTVVRTDGAVTTETIHLSISINDELRAKVREQCDRGCSLHNTQGNCTTSCGYGANTGRCVWRSSKSEMALSDNYSTCSPNLETCPDGECSYLESLHFMNCPQDCTLGSVLGQVTRHDNDRGIKRAKGPCWCEVDTYCTCLPQRPKNTSQPASIVSIDTTGERSGTDTTEDESESCSSSCKAAITGSLAATVAGVVLALLGWMIWRRRRRQHQAASLKHVSSLVSMNAVPSDYIVDDSRDLRGHVSRQTSSPASVHWLGKSGFGHDMQIDDKWEFPRRYLTLEHVIGEGEFGQVVKAQAFMLRGQEGNTVVAVKMLKPDASGAEYQDLVSEIQLLKEVNHPNVIQLLGVCTQKGPLYAIVEYCELGSLRNFLRSSKFKNKGNWDSRQKNGNDGEALSDSSDVRTLTCRDLFSFAWQIAKGMDYLASLKIVHRDLAARNVLVTDGLKMKISDFGLSRDVYEADTYLKMSKGRIPVKWMAPESLYAQIYTTKSDIWSYGIVLWEIVTLGASPYPGIPPERLFPLLSTGYRMDRPDDCPEELYAIMQKCWKAEPENRPPFSVLRDILDNLLQQNTEYLDLSHDNYLLQGTSFDNDDKHKDSQPAIESGAKPQYSNVCSVNHCPPNVYVSTQWEGDDLDSEECPEMCKLLGSSEVVDRQQEAARQSDIIMDKTKDGRKKSDKILVHENLTYV